MLPLEVEHDPLNRALGVAGEVGLEQRAGEPVEPELQARERRLELVGHARRELALALEQLLNCVAFGLGRLFDPDIRPRPDRPSWL